MTLLGSNDYCPVHGERLQEDRVLVIYGFFRTSSEPPYSEYPAASRTLFPHSHFLAYGGCRVGDVLFRKVFFCKECRIRHREWCESHGVELGLPPTKEEQDRYCRHICGNEKFAGVVPPEVEGLIAEGRIARATLVMKAANPQVEVSLLKSHADYLRRTRNT